MEASEQERNEAPGQSESDLANENIVMQCVVSRAHALILGVSSLFGLAPLRFKSRYNGFTVSISDAMCIYSYILVTIMVTVIMCGLVDEITTGTELSDMMSSRIKQVVLTFDALLAAATGGAGIYAAPKRMRNMFKFMESVASVDHSIGACYSRTTERKLCAILLALLIFFLILAIEDFSFYVLQAKEIGREWTVVVNCLGYYVIWCVSMTLELQFAFTALSVRARFQAVNDALALTAKLVSSPVKSISEPPSLNILAIHVISNQHRCSANFSLLVDTLHEGDRGVIIRNSVIGEPRILVPPCEAIRKLTCLHGALCDTVREIDNSYGLPLILIFVSTLLHLVEMPYVFIVEIIESRNRVHFLMLQILWITMLMLRVFILVEPCYYTAVEGNKTKDLVCQLMRSAPTNGLLSSQLEVFSRQLLHQSTAYSPMGMCTLDRPLLASIIGAITTYLIILLQFQIEETDNHINNLNNTV